MSCDNQEKSNIIIFVLLMFVWNFFKTTLYLYVCRSYPVAAKSASEVSGAVIYRAVRISAMPSGSLWVLWLTGLPGGLFFEPMVRVVSQWPALGIQKKFWRPARNCDVLVNARYYLSCELSSPFLSLCYYGMCKTWHFSNNRFYTQTFRYYSERCPIKWYVNKRLHTKMHYKFCTFSWLCTRDVRYLKDQVSLKRN